MYKIITITDSDGNTIFIVYDKLTNKEVSRYLSYDEAYKDVLGRN